MLKYIDVYKSLCYTFLKKELKYLIKNFNFPTNLLIKIV